MAEPADPTGAVQEMLSWAKEFEAGSINDPSVVDGTLEPGERFAVRIAPVTRARFVVPSPVPRLAEVGATGTLIVSDRRAIFHGEGGETEQWAWASDVGEVTPLRRGLGAMWSPSPARYEEGVRMEGVVVPGFAVGDPLSPEQGQAMLPAFLRVRVAWMASQPSGVEGWRRDFLAKYGTG